MTNIKSYWIDQLQNVREYQAIASTEDKELTDIKEHLDNLIDDQFIKTATEKGILRREKILGIAPYADYSLESRRFRTLSRWNNKLPYTLKALKEKLDELCGKNNYIFDLQNNDYIFKLVVHLGLYGSLDELQLMLKKVLPCNLVLDLDNVLYEKKESGIYSGSSISSGTHYVLTSDINDTYDLDGNSYTASAMVDSAAYQLTNDINEVMNSTATVRNASVPITGTQIKIT